MVIKRLKKNIRPYINDRKKISTKNKLKYLLK